MDDTQKAGKTLRDYDPSVSKGLTDNRRNDGGEPIPPHPTDLPRDSPRHSVSGSIRQKPDYNQFLLKPGENGVRVHRGWLEWYVNRISFEKKFIYDKQGELLEEVNGLVEQAEIEGVKIQEIAGSTATAIDPWIELDWWGNVYAVIELNPESGEPTALTLEGPEKPTLKNIALLNEELSRGSDGSGGGDRYGFTVLIGSCEEDEVIDQRHQGPLQWYLAFIPEAEASSSGSSSSGSSQPSSSSGQSSSGSSQPSSSSGQSSRGSSKDTAIDLGPDGEYRKWYAMEATEVLFFDFQDFQITNGKTKIEIDPIVVFSCEPNSLRAFASPSIGTCNATVDREFLTLSARYSAKKRVQKTSVMLKGVRRGFAGVRNQFATYDDFVDNECRLNPRMTREQVIEALKNRGVTE
jgi:hypothetical protein